MMIGIAIRSILTAGTPNKTTTKENAGDAMMTPSATSIDASVIF
jgi:hypothetical protein